MWLGEAIGLRAGEAERPRAAVFFKSSRCDLVAGFLRKAFFSSVSRLDAEELFLAGTVSMRGFGLLGLRPLRYLGLVNRFPIVGTGVASLIFLKGCVKKRS